VLAPEGFRLEYDRDCRARSIFPFHPQEARLKKP
jgi:hypothetical protein